jgi:uncharacterized membrane protein YeaQ/YmgE (transglycosylase-associated protein family)
MDENGRAPGGLWVLPIFLGIIGGVIATVLLYFLLFVIFGNVFMTYLF